MSEVDKIIENLKKSGRKVEEFYTGNKTSDKNVANIEDNVMSQQAFYELIDSFEVVSKLTMYGRKSIKHYVKKMQAELEQKDKRIQELEEELRKYKSLDYMFKIQNEENYVDMKKIYFEWLDSIPKQVVIEALNTHKFAYEELNKKYDNTYYEDDEIRTRDFYMIVTEDRIVQVLKKLLEGEVGRRLGE